MKPILSEPNKEELNSFLNIQPLRKQKKPDKSNKAINHSINQEASKFPS